MLFSYSSTLCALCVYTWCILYCLHKYTRLNVGCLFAFTFVFASQPSHCVCSLYGVWLFPHANHPIWPPFNYSDMHIHRLFFFFCMSICITPIHCLCMPLFLPMYRKVGVPLFCLRCWPKSQVCHNPNSIFPERCFYSASWAITVIAVIIGIILTLVPLCSRKGLTLGAIHADWLDQPGIPKVRKVLQYFFFFLAEFKIIKYQFMKKTRQFLTFKPDSSLSR